MRVHGSDKGKGLFQSLKGPFIQMAGEGGIRDMDGKGNHKTELHGLRVIDWERPHASWKSVAVGNAKVSCGTMEMASAHVLDHLAGKVPMEVVTWTQVTGIRYSR